MDDFGFYSLSQLASCRGTEKQRGQIGVFPWSKKHIRKMVTDGLFPPPSVRMYGQMMWPKEVIHRYRDALMSGHQGEPLEAEAIRAAVAGA